MCLIAACETQGSAMGALTGKVAVVIGGHSGFGEAIVQRFHREGAQIAIAARRIDVVNAAASAVGGKGYQCDITNNDGLDSRGNGQ